MQNLTTLKTVLFAALLTVPALSASAQCPGGGACPQAVEDCACPVQMGSGEDCACPQVKTIETRQPGGCIQAASKNGDCGEAKPVAYTLAPRSDEFKMSARQQLFSESAEEKEDRDGSIFGGGPCVSCDKNGSISAAAPAKPATKTAAFSAARPVTVRPAVRKRPIRNIFRTTFFMTTAFTAQYTVSAAILLRWSWSGWISGLKTGWTTTAIPANSENTAFVFSVAAAIPKTRF